MDINPVSSGSKTDRTESNIKADTAKSSGENFALTLSREQQKQKEAEQRKLKETCQQLESFMLQRLLDGMYRTIPESDFIPKSSGHDIWQSMLNEQYAQTMAKSGSTGLADIIYDQLNQSLYPGSHSTAESELTVKRSAGAVNRTGAGETGASLAPARRQAPAAEKAGPQETVPGKAGLAELVKRAAQKYNLPVALVNSVIEAESGFNPRSLSSTGAAGLMQLMPGTARAMGVRNVWDPADNIDGGCRYLRQMLDRYRGSLPLALAAYNAGPGSVDKYGGIPPFAETQAYVRRILSSYRD